MDNKSRNTTDANTNNKQTGNRTEFADDCNNTKTNAATNANKNKNK